MVHRVFFMFKRGYVAFQSTWNSEEKKLLNKVVILVFFAQKKNPLCFIKLRLNH